MHLIGENGAGAVTTPVSPFLFYSEGEREREREREGGGCWNGWFLCTILWHKSSEENDFLNCCQMLAIWCHENKEDQFSRFQINNLSTFFSLWLWLLFLLGQHLLKISFFCCVHLHYLFGWVDLSQLETFSAM